MFSYTLIQMLHIRRGHLCYIQIQAYNQQFFYYFFNNRLSSNCTEAMARSISTLSLVNTYFCYRPNIFAFKHEYLNTFSQLKGVLFCLIWVKLPAARAWWNSPHQQGATVVSLGCSCIVLHEYCGALLWDFAGYKAKREASFGLQLTGMQSLKQHRQLHRDHTCKHNTRPKKHNPAQESLGSF